ncbi:MAG: hypothetical protein F6K24_02315 [Okeania sp. SIO2D1]|nr:hypothetical protein [Okeania sp. SIO2D1]
MSAVLAVFTIVTVMSLLTNKSGFSAPDWQDAHQVLPSSLKKQYALDYLDDSRIWHKFYHKIAAVEITTGYLPLYIINNSRSEALNSPLCGYQGCLATAYIRSNEGNWRRVFQGYFQPFTTLDTSHIQLQNAFSSMPCIKITEFADIKTYCFDKQEQQYFLR